MTGLPIGASVWLDANGRTIAAKIIGKKEVITVSDDGDWTRRYRLELARPEGSLLQQHVPTSPERYDALHRGDTVRVRTLNCCPMFAAWRTAPRSPGSASSRTT